MHHKITVLFFFLLLLLYSCNRIRERDFSGEWIVNKATYKNADVVMATKTIKLAFLPTGYENKQTVRFDVADSSVDMPGMYTEDVPCRWLIKDKKLILTFDTLRFAYNALLPLDSIKNASLLPKNNQLKKVYAFKRDSILRALDINIFKKALPVYLGAYKVEKSPGALILTSPTTRFELLNSEYIFNRSIDQLFRSLRRRPSI